MAIFRTLVTPSGSVAYINRDTIRIIQVVPMKDKTWGIEVYQQGDAEPCGTTYSTRDKAIEAANHLTDNATDLPVSNNIKIVLQDVLHYIDSDHNSTEHHEEWYCQVRDKLQSIIDDKEITNN